MFELFLSKTPNKEASPATARQARHTAEKYAQQENPERIRDFLKKIGSNFRIADRTLVLDFKNAFKIAEKYHAEALCAETVSYDFTKSTNWRRGRDSNPGRGYPLNILAGYCFQPLSHLSWIAKYGDKYSECRVDLQ